MVLPDGLVISVKYFDQENRPDYITTWDNLLTKGGQDIMSIVKGKKALHSLSWQRLVAVKILGVQKGYECKGLKVVDYERSH